MMKLFFRLLYTASIWIIMLGLSAVLWPNIQRSCTQVLGIVLMILSWGLAGKLD